MKPMDTKNGQTMTAQEADLLRSVNEIIDVLGDIFANRLADRIGGMLPDFEARQKQTDYALQGIRSSLSSLETAGGQAELLDSANKTIRLLGDEFYDVRVIQPMVRGLFPVVDLLHQAMEKQNADTGLLSALLAQVEQFLALYGIEAYRHEPNVEFDPAVMKPLQTTVTNEPSLDGLLAESLQCGFRTPDCILRLETVSLHRFDIHSCRIRNTGTSTTPNSLQQGVER